MKKFITILCVLSLLIATMGFAAAETYEGPAAFVVSKNNHLVGIRTPAEMYNLPMYSSYFNTITGIKVNGVVRDRGLAQYLTVNDVTMGLTTLEVTIVIDERYTALVDNLVSRYSDEISTQSIIAATYYVKNNHIGHMFYTEPHKVLVVGTVYFKDQVLPVMLCAGDFNHSNTMELGFLASNPFVGPSENLYR